MYGSSCAARSEVYEEDPLRYPGHPATSSAPEKAPEAKEVDDAVILVDMARRVLAEEEEHPPVEERYTVVLEHCPSCGQTQGEGAEVRDPREAILPGCVERAMAGRSR